MTKEKILELACHVGAGVLSNVNTQELKPEHRSRLIFNLYTEIEAVAARLSIAVEE